MKMISKKYKAIMIVETHAIEVADRLIKTFTNTAVGPQICECEKPGFFIQELEIEELDA